MSMERYKFGHLWNALISLALQHTILLLWLQQHNASNDYRYYHLSPFNMKCIKIKIISLSMTNNIVVNHMVLVSWPHPNNPGFAGESRRQTSRLFGLWQLQCCVPSFLPRIPPEE